MFTVGVRQTRNGNVCTTTLVCLHDAVMESPTGLFCDMAEGDWACREAPRQDCGHWCRNIMEAGLPESSTVYKLDVQARSFSCAKQQPRNKRDPHTFGMLCTSVQKQKHKNMFQFTCCHHIVWGRGSYMKVNIEIVTLLPTYSDIPGTTDTNSCGVIEC